jgi:hypothetical protein
MVGLADLNIAHAFWLKSVDYGAWLGLALLT